MNSGASYGGPPGGAIFPQDFTAPATVNLSASLGLSPGNDLFILYKSGVTSAFDEPPHIDQTGYVGSPFKDDDPGSSGGHFPSFYMSSYWGINSADPSNAGSYGVFLQALVGAITDSSGNVLSPFPVGAVFAIPDGVGGFTQSFGFEISFSIPANGAFLQLGFNDDIFSDNHGSEQVCVGSSLDAVQACARAPAEVPEPGTLALIGAGLAGFCVFRHRKVKT